MKDKGRILKLGIIFAILISILGIFVLVNADNTKSYVVDVVDPKGREEDCADNDEIEIKKSILKDQEEEPYYDEKELTYQVEVSNILEKKDLEIALVIDTSYSMETNDQEELMKQKAKELVKEIYESNSGVEIQLFSASSTSKTEMLSADWEEDLTTAIDSLILGDGSNIVDGLNAAQNSFTAEDNKDRYIILFTDATDKATESLARAYTNDIKIISVLINNIVSNSYVNLRNNRVFFGKMQMVYDEDFIADNKLYEEFNIQKIVNMLNNSLINVEIKDDFSDALKQYFTFEVISETDSIEDNVENVEKTNEGYTWKIDTIKAGETKILTYKLKIKEGINIEDPAFLYHNLVVSEEIEANYEADLYDSDEREEENFTLKKDYIPTIQICDEYSVTIKAVSEENDGLVIEGIKFDVVATNDEGNVVYRGTSETDDRGEITIDKLRTTGKVTFEITPEVEKAGYTITDSSLIEITNHFGTYFTVDTIEWQDKCSINNDKRNIIINYPISTQKFTLEVNLTELNNSNVKLGNTQFQLIQPKLNNQFEMTVKLAETDSEGKLEFYPTIMTQPGVYEYVLTQKTVQDGYNSVGNATIKIKFDANGNVVRDGVDVIYNEYVTGERISANHVLIKVQDPSEKEDMFNLELNLADEDNNLKKLAGAQYNIEVSRVNAGNQVTSMYYNCLTNEKGKLLIDLPGSGNIQLKITEVKAPTGYNIDDEAKIVTINRVDGKVSSVLQAYNEISHSLVDASAYSSENKLIVNLTNKIKNERNIINVILTDSEEEDIGLSGIELKLTNTITNEEYTATTDSLGKATFQIDDETQGDYNYVLKVTSEIPYIYKNIADSILNIHFDGDKHIELVSDFWDNTSPETNPLMRIDPVQIVDNGQFADYTSTLHLGAELKEECAYQFVLELTDKEDSAKPLEGAKYDIQIVAGNIVRTIKNRSTDDLGCITTNLILDENIDIIITQVESISGYKIDNETKLLHFKYQNQILSNTTVDQDNVEINGTQVKYKHTNMKKTANDVLLSLVINKEDVDGFAIGNLPVRIYQETGTNIVSGEEAYIAMANGTISPNGDQLGTWIIESATATSTNPESITIQDPDHDELNITTNTSNLGTISLQGLVIKGAQIPGEQRFTLCVVEVDPKTSQDKEGTLVKYKITYRYNEEKDIIEITNVETFYGNRLVKEKKYDGYESFLGYESNIYTTIYGNYEDVGNLSLDLNKFDKNGKELVNAKYKVQVIRLDGSNLQREVTVRNDTIDITGITVAAGTQIILTEIQSPLGYAVNEISEIIEVEKVDTNGEITLKLQPNEYSPQRIQLTEIGTYPTTSGKLKTEYKIDLTDYELDTFKVKLIAKDPINNIPIPGYSFTITSNQGARKTTSATNADGEVQILVGANYENNTIEYNIESNEIARYYKNFDTFKLLVKFDADQRVDTDTLNIQTDPNHPDKWEIAQVNVVDGDDMVIEVYIEPEDPLVVKIKTIDDVSGNTITTATYSIDPSVNIPGIGVLDSATNITKVEVGYVEKAASREYTLKTEIGDNYISVPDQTFIVYYDEDGNIDTQQPPDVRSGDNMKITSYSNKTLEIENRVQPRQGIQIVNNNFFTKTQIPDAEFDVTTEDNVTTRVSMGATGINSLLGSKHGDANSTVEYTIHQAKVSDGYATIPDFKIKVAYDQNRQISGVQLENINDKDCSIWVNPSYIVPSTNQNLGYNGNDKGIVKIEINSYYDLRVDIENIDRLDPSKKIIGTNYRVEIADGPSGSVETESNGIGTSHLDKLAKNETITYEITEVAPAIDYQPIEEPIQVTVAFDGQGYITASQVNVVQGHGNDCATASDTYSSVINDVERFTIKVTITNLPKFRMKIKNEDTFNQTALQGTYYTITSDVGSSIDNTPTDTNGETTLRVAGNPTNTIKYTIHENTPSAGYQSLEEDVEIDVVFDSTGVVNSCNIVKGNRFTNANTILNTADSFEKLTIEVTIKSVELLKFNINNIYNKLNPDGTETPQPVGAATYKISARNKTDNQELDVDTIGTTDDTGHTIIGMDKALSSKTIEYVITEDVVPAGYKTLDTYITIDVTIDGDGKIIANQVNIVSNSDNTSSVNFAKIESIDVTNFTINLKIVNNELLDFVIQDIWEMHTEITSWPITDDSGVQYMSGQIQANQSITIDGIQNKIITKIDDSGVTHYYYKYAKNNQSGFVYSIKAEEVINNTEPRNLDVDKLGTTDNYGKVIISMDRALAGKTIHYTIKQEQKAPGYETIAEEVVIEVQFDNDGRIRNNSCRIIPNNNGNNISDLAAILKVIKEDNEIQLQFLVIPVKEFGIHFIAQDMYTGNKINKVVANAFLTNQDTLQHPNYTTDGIHDVNIYNSSMQVEDEYKYLYTGADRDNNNIPDITDGEDYMSLGKYESGRAESRILRVTLSDVPKPYQYYNNSTGNSQEYGILINVDFDENGIPQSASLRTGLNGRIGLLADERYVSVTPSGYSLVITMKFYPMLWLNMEAEDMYTEQHLDSSLTFTTTSILHSPSSQDVVQEGWINGLYDPARYGGCVYSQESSTEFLRTSRAEAGKERMFYIFENTVPNESYYQRYKSRDMVLPTTDYIAKIKVKYDASGKIESAEVVEYRSHNNITNGYVDLEVEDGYYLSVRVKYAPTTRMVFKVVDRVSGVGLSNIYVYPYNDEKMSYPSNFIDYLTTSNSGETSLITYWGANEANLSNQYKIRTSLNGGYNISQNYNGYYESGDVILDVGYDGNGRISTAKVLSTNIFGDAANAETRWEDTIIYVTIKLDRKFNLKIEKKDLYDATKNLSGVKFDISSDKSENASIYAWQTATIGRIHPGKKVTYDLTEVGTPNGYEPLQNFKMYVEFNVDGTVERAYVDNSNAQYFSVVSKADVNTGINGVNTTDLEVIIRDVPVFGVKINLTDEFYSNIKLQSGTFNLINDKGETAVGSLETNSDGVISTSIGRPHPNETVIYTLTQTNTIDLYKTNSDQMKFEVTFNESGVITNYSVIDGTKRCSIKPNIYVGHQEITLDVTNVPENINIGIINIDATTREGINDVEYKVDIEEVSTQQTSSESFRTQTNADGEGIVAGKLDNVKETTQQRAVIYTISEINVPGTFRKIQDVKIEVIFNTDGSIATYDVISNPSEVNVMVYRKGTNIQFLNGLPTHIRLTIENDNRYDLIIKDEDENYQGLGIQGTTYNVTIDGHIETLPATDEDGITRLNKLDGSGQINIVIGEANVGNGYRKDNNNEANITLDKGANVYSLELNRLTQGYIDKNNAQYPNSTDTKAIIEVDEGKGTITVTFKNKTKSELTIVKDDYKTGQTLQDAKFTIVEQKIDNSGYDVGSPKTINSNDGDIVGQDGKLYYDLGETYRSETIKYTIKEVSTPNGYMTSDEITIIAEYDTFGRLESLTDNLYNVSTTIDSDNSNGMIVIIGNVEIPEEPSNPDDPVDIIQEYKIKVATADSVTKKRINDSKIKLGVRDDNGVQIIESEEQVTSNLTRGGYLVEKGVIVLDGLTQDGIINIDVDQTETATGYNFSDKTSGTVKVEIKHTSDTINQHFMVVNFENPTETNGLEVIVDNTNKEILIVIYNDPVVTLNINKYYEKYEYNEQGIAEKTELPLAGARFTITSEIQEKSQIITTNFSTQTISTDDQGQVTIGIGKPYEGKTILYTLKESVPEGFEQIEDIIIQVKYDTSGLIKKVEVLSDGDITKVTDNGKGKRELSIRVRNTGVTSNTNYKVILRKHSIENGEYDYLIPNTEYRIKVQEEYGEEREWIDITNEEGMIKSATFTGYGRIKIIYTELTAADGYKKDEITYEIEVNRDKETGLISEYSSDEGYEIDEENNIIYVDPKDDLDNNRYDLFVNKVDKLTNTRITQSSATFDVELIEKQQVVVGETTDDDGNTIPEIEEQEVATYLGTITTDQNGIAKLPASKMPEEEGTYKIKLTETQTPEGYEAKEEGYFVEVTFEKNETDDNFKITNVQSLSGRYVDILINDKDTIKLNINNEKAGASNELLFDITKVDSETDEPITNNEAIFRLKYEDGNFEYIETDEETGKLKMPNITLPDDSEFSDQQTLDDGTIILPKVEKNYELTEIMAPEGYLIDSNPINMKVVFVKDENNRKLIQSVEITRNGEVIESTEEDRVITFNIENKEGELINDENRGTYTINIKKVDSETDEPITEHATFEVTLENGQKLTASTDEEGNIKIENIKVPLTVTQNLGPYSYIIEETKAADGYELVAGYSIMELTFKELVDEQTGEGTGMYGIDDMVHIPVLTRTQSAEITSYTESEVNLKVKNTAKEEDLYIKSKEYIISDEERYVEDAELEENVYEEGDKYIIGLNPKLTVESEDTETEWTKGTKLETFIENIETNAESIKIYKEDNEEITEEEYIGTNMIVEFRKGEKVIRLVLIVKGDLNGDGILNLSDTTKAKRYIKNDDYSILDTTEKKLAYDVNFDGELNMKDTNDMQRAQANDDVRELDV